MIASTSKKRAVSMSKKGPVAWKNEHSSLDPKPIFIGTTKTELMKRDSDLNIDLSLTLDQHLENGQSCSMFESMCRQVQNSPIFISDDGFGSCSRTSSPPSEETVATPVRKVVFNCLSVGNLEEMCEIIAVVVCKKLEKRQQENSLWTKARKCLKRAEGLMAILKRSDD